HECRSLTVSDTVLSVTFVVGATLFFRERTDCMSGITGIGGYSASLLSLLTQTDNGASDASLLNSLASSALPATSQEGSGSTAASGSSSDLKDQIQTAVTTALQSAEQSGSTDLKSVVYNALVQVHCK